MSSTIEGLLKKSTIPTPELALEGRATEIETALTHAVNKEELKRELKSNEAEIILGLGCFWGAERKFWQANGVTLTSVGYAGGYTPNPTYEEVCTGQTGHSEVVRVVYDTNILSLQEVLAVFWENHDPTQGMRQGNDIGSQYRSVIYAHNETDLKVAEESVAAFQKSLLASGYGMITTEVEMLKKYYFAEGDHQQYLHKNPQGYCGIKGTGVRCVI
ncbi:peptide-methionine (S)-S-oxide reductase MsrA [Marinomonas epiphytica]